MPKAYSADMRERVIAEVEGGASRREAAEEFEVSASTAITSVRCFRRAPDRPCAAGALEDHHIGMRAPCTVDGSMNGAKFVKPNSVWLRPSNPRVRS